jgi:hypothetical protein
VCWDGPRGSGWRGWGGGGAVRGVLGGMGMLLEGVAEGVGAAGRRGAGAGMVEVVVVRGRCAAGDFGHGGVAGHFCDLGAPSAVGGVCGGVLASAAETEPD